MAVLTSVIGGRYSATYVASDVGVTDDPGYTLGWTPSYDKIKDTDAWGASVIDALWLGFSEVSCEFVSKEWKTGSLKAVNPWNATVVTGVGQFRPGIIGRRVSDQSITLVLSSTASTPAASSPASLTATFAIIADGYPVKIVFGPKHRKVPCKFELMSYDAGAGVPEYFAVT